MSASEKDEDSRKERRIQKTNERGEKGGKSNLKASALNTKIKIKEDATRRNYLHPYVLASAWDSTVLVCLVNTIKRPWNFDADATEFNLFDELREYPFVEAT